MFLILQPVCVVLFSHSTVDITIRGGKETDEVTSHQGFSLKWFVKTDQNWIKHGWFPKFRKSILRSK